MIMFEPSAGTGADCLGIGKKRPRGACTCLRVLKGEGGESACLLSGVILI